MAYVNMTFSTLKRTKFTMHREFGKIDSLIARYADDYGSTIFENRLMSMTVRGISVSDAYNLLAALYATLGNDEKFKSIRLISVYID